MRGRKKEKVIRDTAKKTHQIAFVHKKFKRIFFFVSPTSSTTTMKYLMGNILDDVMKQWVDSFTKLLYFLCWFKSWKIVAGY